MAVDEILASGEYTDRRFRLWELSQNMRTGEDCWMVWEPFLRRTELTPAQMRLLIERDLHRDECRGLDSCPDHPVPIVYQDFNEDGATAWGVVGAHRGNGLIFDIPHVNAMNMARALAVGE